jgi:adenine specific DNA methylase Mod
MDAISFILFIAAIFSLTWKYSDIWYSIINLYFNSNLQRRESAESKWQEEQALRESEQQRLRELEEIKRELERLLAEERQAKKDEEIVRNLQSKSV